MSQRPTCTWTGVSGTQYIYRIFPIGTPMRDVAGNYIYTYLSHVDDKGVNRWNPIYIGQGNLADRSDLNSLHKGFCIRQAGATHFHAHINAAKSARLAEESDLLAGRSTPCND